MSVFYGFVKIIMFCYILSEIVYYMINKFYKCLKIYFCWKFFVEIRGMKVWFDFGIKWSLVYIFKNFYIVC